MAGNLHASSVQYSFYLRERESTWQVVQGLPARLRLPYHLSQVWRQPNAAGWWKLWSCTLEIPNQLLYMWHRSCTPYMDHVNGKIKEWPSWNRVIGSSAFDLKQRRSKVTSKCQKPWAANIMTSCNSHTECLCSMECENVDEIESRVQHLETAIIQKDEEITELLEDMAVLVAEDTPLSDTTNVYRNKGKTVEEVSPRRKMSKVTDFTKQVCWIIRFDPGMHKARLWRCQLVMHPSHSQHQIRPQYTRSCTYLIALLWLSVTSNLPSLHRLKTVCSTINDSRSQKTSRRSACRPLEDALKQEISKIV